MDKGGYSVVNRQQIKIVVRIYEEFMSGKTVGYIARIFKAEKIKAGMQNTIVNLVRFILCFEMKSIWVILFFKKAIQQIFFTKGVS